MYSSCSPVTVQWAMSKFHSSEEWSFQSMSALTFHGEPGGSVVEL